MSIRNNLTAKSPPEQIVRWTDDERKRLWDSRQKHSRLNWTEFHELNLFPDRSRISLYHEYRRMDKLDTLQRLYSSADKPHTSNITILKTKKHARFSALPDTEQGRLSKHPRIETDSDEEESNDDDGDIENTGETKPLLSPQSSLRRSRDPRLSPVKSQNASRHLVPVPRQPGPSDTSPSTQPNPLVHPLPDRPVIFVRSQSPVTHPSPPSTVKPTQPAATEKASTAPISGNQPISSPSTPSATISTSTPANLPTQSIQPTTTQEPAQTSSHPPLNRERSSTPTSAAPSFSEITKPPQNSPKPDPTASPNQTTQQPKTSSSSSSSSSPTESLTADECLHGAVQLIGRFAKIQTELHNQQAETKDSDRVSSLEQQVRMLQWQLPKIHRQLVTQDHSIAGLKDLIVSQKKEIRALRMDKEEMRKEREGERKRIAEIEEFMLGFRKLAQGG